MINGNEEVVDFQNFNYQQLSDSQPLEQKGIVAGGCNVPFGGEMWPNPSLSLGAVRDKVSTKTFIIGLGHKAQQGKDTLAAFAIEKFGPRPDGEWGNYFPIDIRRYAFGDELKIEVFDFLQSLSFATHRGYLPDFIHPGHNLAIFRHLETERIFTPEEKIVYINANKIDLRVVLQEWGTEFRRKQDPDYWVKKVLDKIKVDNPQVALITDMRFPNETVICDVQINVTRSGFKSGIPQHSSETELDTFPYPYVIVAGSKEDLKFKGENLIEGLLQNRGLLPR